jgi:hypothetical protein
MGGIPGTAGEAQYSYSGRSPSTVQGAAFRELAGEGLKDLFNHLGSETDTAFQADLFP